ncbi:MAG TPA: hypothetical protein VGD16_10125 [Enterovirga sp.]|jgi:hypothetical protein
MSGLPDDEASPGEGEAGVTGQPSSTAAPLPKDVQEHLGRQLRSAYNAKAERPAFLGDPAVPPQFERLIRRIEVSEKVREIGVEAVRQALEPGAPLPRVRTKPKEPEGGA